VYRANDDPILFQGPADHHTGSALAGGRVEITRQRFLFRSFDPSHSRDLEVPLMLIARVTACSVASPNINGVELADDRGATLRFLVENPASFIQALETILATYGRSAGYR
jgi:hypothetical protein